MSDFNWCCGVCEEEHDNSTSVLQAMLRQSFEWVESWQKETLKPEYDNIEEWLEKAKELIGGEYGN